jgi:DNA replication protein DnaC
MKQEQALELLKTGRNVFVTGPAGSGKTYLVNSYIRYLKEHEIDVGITASTGIAATHMGGMTIHSWAGIGVNSYIDEGDIEAMADKPYLAKRFEKVKVLIIDEVSMLDQ